MEAKERSDDGFLNELEGPLREYAEDMEARFEKLKEQLAATRLWVVVLGPGEGGYGYEKRCEIRSRLNEMDGVRAFFPEDDDYKEYVEDRYGLSDASVIETEIIQCSAADVVLALETTEGPRQEVAMFSRRDDIWPHLFPLVHERHEGMSHSTLPGYVRERLQVRHYSDDQMQQCHVASELCPRVVRERQIERSGLLGDIR